MGLLRVSSSLRSSTGSKSTWATESSAVSSISSVVDDANALVQRVRLLEGQLLHRDETIAHLSKMMRAEVKVRSAELHVNYQRIQLLEKQLERLVDLSSSMCAEQGGSTKETSLPDARDEEKFKETSHDEDADEGSACSCASFRPRDGERREAGDMELSALTELLSRVLAEKDRLKLENQNLKSLLKQDADSKAPGSYVVSGCPMPSSIEELDRVVAMRCGPKSGCEVRPEDECQGGKEAGNPCKDDRGDKEAGNPCKDDRGEKMKKTMLYQMSFRVCPESGPDTCDHLKYLGAYVSTSRKDRKAELRTIVMDHFNKVYDMAQGGENSGSSKKSTSGFLLSSLARRLAEHCQSVPGKDDFFVWCVKNVKVEIKNRLDVDETERNGIEFNEKIITPPPREKSKNDKSENDKDRERSTKKKNSKAKKHSQAKKRPKGVVGKGHSRKAVKLLRKNSD